MKKIRKYIFVLSTLAAILGGLTSCGEEDLLGTAPRLFRPSSTVLSSDGNWILAQWDKNADAKYYQLELSRDSFATIDRIDTTANGFLLIQNVNWDQTYQVRIKAVGTTLESDYFVCSEVVVADYPTLLKDVPSDDIIDNSVIMRWTAGTSPYTSFKVYSPTDSLIDTVAVTPAEYAQGFKIVSGLTGGTPYKVEAFINNVYCGKKRITTKAAQSFENPVDLRNINDEAADSMLTDKYINSLPVVDGVTTIVLKGGMNYFMTLDSIVRSLKFVTGYSFAGKATLRMSNACDLYGNINSLSFENVNIFGVEANKTTANYGGSYVYNGSRALTIGSLSFVNCTIKYLRGVCRIKSTGAFINNFIMDNCITDSIGGYGIATTDATGAQIKNMSVTKSTMIRTDIFLKNQKTDTSTVFVDYCTFYNTPKTATTATSGTHYLDFSGKNIKSVTFKNCLLGPGNGFPMGIKSLSITEKIMDNNYTTTDATWFTTTTTSTSILIDAADAGITSTNLWRNLSTGDLKIVGAFTKAVGDPRWR
ncbi:MAG TPA: DUF5123 domain-containing protein [Bacteroidales bacterium]|nr:DUF5123 domain-containing protein [Bacteroidales bacterium]